MAGRDFKQPPTLNGKALLVANTGQTYGPNYLDYAQMGAAPANPASLTRRLFVDPATGKLSVKKSTGQIISLEEPIGTGVGFVHTPDKNVGHQYCDPIRGSDTNAGTSEGDATFTLAQAKDNLANGAGRIDIVSCRYDMDESSTDFPPNGNFFHQSNCIIRGQGMRKANVGGTEINWIGGDGSKAIGTFGATAVNATHLIKASGDALLTGDVAMFIRIKKAGWPLRGGGSSDHLTWVIARQNNSEIDILDPIHTAITGVGGSGNFEIFRPIPLWQLGDPGAGKSWGAVGGLEDIMFNVDGDLSVLPGGGTTAVGLDSNGYLQTGGTRPGWRSSFCLLMGINMQNGGWGNRIKFGDKEDAGLPGGQEYFHDCAFMFYAYSADPAGKGAGGMGMNYFRDLWMHGGEYQILSAFSTNPTILSGGSSPGRWGRACITIPDGNGSTQNLQIPMWKVEMRDRPASWVNPGMGGALPPNGNPEEPNGVPYFYDIYAQKLNLSGDAWSFQQEAGSPSFTPTIPAIRYSSPADPNIHAKAVSGTKFADAFDVLHSSVPANKFRVSLPSGKPTNIDLGGYIAAEYASSGTPSAVGPFGRIAIRPTKAWFLTETGWKSVTIA